MLVTLEEYLVLVVGLDCRLGQALESVGEADGWRGSSPDASWMDGAGNCFLLFRVWTYRAETDGASSGLPLLTLI